MIQVTHFFCGIPYSYAINKEAINMIVELEKEHDHAGEILRQIRAVTSDYTLPLDACGTYRLVYKTARRPRGTYI